MTLLSMSISAGVLILLILLLRAAAVNYLPKRLFVYLWIIVLLRLLIPGSIPSSFGIALPALNILEGHLQSQEAVWTEEAAASLQGSADVPAGNEDVHSPADAAAAAEQARALSDDATGEAGMNGLAGGAAGEAGVFGFAGGEIGVPGVDGFAGDAIGTLNPESLAENIFGVPGMSFQGSADTALAVKQQNSDGAVDFRKAAGLIWLSGVVGLLLYFTIICRREKRMLRQALPVPQEKRRWLCEIVNTGARGDHIYRIMEGIALKFSDRIRSPLVFGVFRPEIIIPRDMISEAWDSDKRNKYSGFVCVMLHELIHIKRKDNLWKLISLLAVCLHWFNPLVWVMYLLFNRDLELSCDESVIRILGENQKETYALALISLAEYQTGRILTGSSFGKKAVRERVVAIMKYRKKSAAAIVCAVILMILSVTVFAEKAADETAEPDVAGIQTEAAAFEAAEAVIKEEAGVSDEAEHLEEAGVTAGAEHLEEAGVTAGAELLKDSEALSDVRLSFYQFAEYVDKRLVYDRRNNCLLYEDHPVGYFKDEVRENEYYEGYLNSQNDKDAVAIIVHRDENGEFLRFHVRAMEYAAEEAAAVDAVRQDDGVKVYDMQSVLDWYQQQASPAEICKEVIAEYPDFPKYTVAAERNRMGRETPGVLYVRIIDGNDWGEDNADEDLILRVQNEIMRRCWELREVCIAWEYTKNPEAYPSEQRHEMRAVTGRTRGITSSLVI